MDSHACAHGFATIFAASLGIRLSQIISILPGPYPDRRQSASAVAIDLRGAGDKSRRSTTGTVSGSAPLRRQECRSAYLQCDGPIENFSQQVALEKILASASLILHVRP